MFLCWWKKGLLIILMIIQLSFRIQGEVINDLIGSSSGWITTHSSPASTCLSQWYLGGYSKFGKNSVAAKTWTGLSTHNTITLSFKAYYIDTWDNETYVAYADGTRVYYDLFEPITSSYFCGRVATIKDVTLTDIVHSSSSLTLEFTTGLDSDAYDESFGVSNLVITVCDSACQGCTSGSPSVCVSCPSSKYLSRGSCVSTCPDDQYPSSNTNVCNDCPSSCRSCYEGSEDKCTACETGKFLSLPPRGRCETSCPAGYWGDQSSNKCIQCYRGSYSPFSCKTCNLGNFFNCQSCNEGAYLWSGQCIYPCPQGYWANQDTNTCVPCHTSTTSPYSCANCTASGNDKCTGCYEHHYLYQGTCLLQCPERFWANKFSVCQPCWLSESVSPYTCKTCQGGGGPSDCTSCSTGFYLYPHTGGECLGTCPNGYWQSPDNTCRPCHYDSVGPYYTCATCNGGLNSQCLSCATGTFLYNGQCLSSCPNTYWANSAANTCEPCWNSIAPNSCLKCNSPSSGSCLKCNNGFFLYPSPLGQCLQRCPDGYWPNSGTGTCDACWINTYNATNPFTCKTCASGAWSIQCTACNSGSYLYPSPEGQCVYPCPDGYWADTDTGICQPCWSSAVQPYSCATCTNAQSIHCLTCKPGTFFYQGQCVNPCPDGYWGDTSVSQCRECWSSNITPFSCKTCDAETSSNCTSCNIGFFRHPMNYGSCLSICPDGFFADNSDWNCKPCYSTGTSNKSACETCSGPLATNCTTCTAPGTYYLPLDSSCVTTCPDGYYPDLTASYPYNLCKECYQYSQPSNLDGTCATCSGPASNECLSCNTSQFLDSSSMCVNVCPTGWWGNSTSRKCQTCFQASTLSDPIQSCYTCTGPNSTNCTSCSFGSFYYAFNSSCLLNCPTTGYWEDSSSNQCKPCYQYTAAALTDGACVTCNGGNSNNCLSCNSTTFLDSTTNKCVFTCPDGYYGDSTTNTCKLCYSTTNASDIMQSCKTCSGGSSSSCLSCDSPNYFYSSNTSCLKECPDGWYPDSNLNACQPCYQNLPPSTWGSCATCTGPLFNNCLTCSNSSYWASILYFDPASNTCVNPCPVGMYANTATNYCAPCFQATMGSQQQSCYTCNGPLSTHCLSCQAGQFYHPQTSTCQLVCPPGTYPNSITSTCDLCYKSTAGGGSGFSCKTCFGPDSTDCTSCSPGLYLENETSTCVITCPKGTYADNQTWICQPCYDAQKQEGSLGEFSCATCDGPLSTHCLSCGASLTFIVATKSCSDTCPCESGYYYDSATGICDSCYSSCSYCIGPNEVDCNYGIDTDVQCLINGYVTKSNQNAHATGFVAKGTSYFTATIAFITNIASGGISMGASTVFSVLALLNLYQYLNVNYPSNVMVFFQYLFEGNFLSFPNLFLIVANPDPQLLNQDSIIQGNNKFNKFQVSNLFLVNSGGDISLLIVLLCLVPISMLINLLVSKRTSIRYNTKKIAVKVKTFFMWNFILSSFMGIYVNTHLSACLQYRYLNISQNWFSNFSIFVSLLITGGCILLLGLAFYISRSNSQLSAKRNESLEILENKENEKIFQERYHHQGQGIKNRYWALALCSRNFLLVPVIAMLSDTPIAQCTLSLLINFAFFIVVSVWWFFESKTKRLILRVCEGLNALIPFLFLLYGINDSRSSLNPLLTDKGKQTLGWFIITFISFVTALSLLFTISETWHVVWHYLPHFLKCVRRCYTSIKKFLQILRARVKAYAARSNQSFHMNPEEMRGISGNITFGDELANARAETDPRDDHSLKEELTRFQDNLIVAHKGYPLKNLEGLEDLNSIELPRRKLIHGLDLKAQTTITLEPHKEDIRVENLVDNHPAEDNQAESQENPSIHRTINQTEIKQSLRKISLEPAV